MGGRFEFRTVQSTERVVYNDIRRCPPMRVLGGTCFDSSQGRVAGELAQLRFTRSNSSNIKQAAPKVIALSATLKAGKCADPR